MKLSNCLNGNSDYVFKTALLPTFQDFDLKVKLYEQFPIGRLSLALMGTSWRALGFPDSSGQMDKHLLRGQFPPAAAARMGEILSPSFTHHPYSLGKYGEK